MTIISIGVAKRDVTTCILGYLFTAARSKVSLVSFARSVSKLVASTGAAGGTPSSVVFCWPPVERRAAASLASLVRIAAAEAAGTTVIRDDAGLVAVAPTPLLAVDTVASAVVLVVVSES